MITKEDALKLKHNTALHHITKRSVTGWVKACWVSASKAKTWKQKPEDFCLTVYDETGMFIITRENAGEWCLDLEDAILGGPSPSEEHEPFRQTILDGLRTRPLCVAIKMATNARLVYADWLAERGEIKLEEIQRELAARLWAIALNIIETPG